MRYRLLAVAVAIAGLLVGLYALPVHADKANSVAVVAKPTPPSDALYITLSKTKEGAGIIQESKVVTLKCGDDLPLRCSKGVSDTDEYYFETCGSGCLHIFCVKHCPPYHKGTEAMSRVKPRHPATGRQAPSAISPRVLKRR